MATATSTSAPDSLINVLDSTGLVGKLTFTYTQSFDIANDGAAHSFSLTPTTTFPVGRYYLKLGVFPYMATGSCAIALLVGFSSTGQILNHPTVTSSVTLAEGSATSDYFKTPVMSVVVKAGQGTALDRSYLLYNNEAAANFRLKITYQGTNPDHCILAYNIELYQLL